MEQLAAGYRQALAASSGESSRRAASQAA
jgi:hypothetical protein